MAKVIRAFGVGSEPKIARHYDICGPVHVCVSLCCRVVLFEEHNMRPSTCGVNIKLFSWNFNGLASWELLFWRGNNLKLAGDGRVISNT